MVFAFAVLQEWVLRVRGLRRRRCGKGPLRNVQCKVCALATSGWDNAL